MVMTADDAIDEARASRSRGMSLARYERLIRGEGSGDLCRERCVLPDQRNDGTQYDYASRRGRRD